MKTHFSENKILKEMMIMVTIMMILLMNTTDEYY